MNPHEIQQETNDAIALAIGRMQIDLIAMQVELRAAQAALAEKEKPDDSPTHPR